MVFSSSIFLLLFLPITIFLYYIARGYAKNLVLLGMSLLFYAWGEPKYIFLILFEIVFNYLSGLLIHRFDKKNHKKLCLILTIIIDIGLLFYFKYFNFFTENIGYLLNRKLDVVHIALPIGISFYTFQALSYVVDVYREDVSVQKNVLDFALYISMFPQLIAGPIVRYSDIETQIRKRTTSSEKYYEGSRRFMIGFCKKILIADRISVLADAAFASNKLSAPLAWVGLLAYTFQIYFDFSGYSDMAIGLGKIFGFEFIENFNYPYISKSIQEFWRRWHISLSSWFRDYVYIPLGGSRCSQKRMYLNYIIVFFVTGFWHGASWNFIVWGLYYVVFIILERMFLNKYLKQIPSALQWIYAMLIVQIGWVFFRAESLRSAICYIANLFRIRSGAYAQLVSNMNIELFIVLMVAIIFSTPLYPKIKGCIERMSGRTVVLDIGIIVTFVLAIAYMVGGGFSAFLYFRF